MLRVIWKLVVVVILIILIYLVLDDRLLHRVIYDPENRWLLRLYRKYLSLDNTDKYGHFFISGLIAFFLNILIGWKIFVTNKMTILRGSLMVGIAFTIMEMHQFFLPHRNFELLDLFFTYAGIFIIGGLRNWVIMAKQLLSRTHTT